MPYNDPARGPRLAFRVGLTALALLCLLLRLARVAGSWESVKGYYGFDLSQGTFWLLLGLALFIGPLLTALAAILPLWWKGRGASRLAAACLCAGLFFALEEGLVRFARAMNGNGGYVGAEPLLSLAVCAVAGAAMALSRRRRT